MEADRTAAPNEFWTLLYEWGDSLDEERKDWIEHRFAELFALAGRATPPAAPAPLPTGKTMQELDSDCLREIVRVSGFAERAAPDEDIIAFIRRISRPQGEASPVADWRSKAARWLRAKADAQERVNRGNPRHVECYPAWKTRARQLRWDAEELETGRPWGSAAGDAAVLAALNADGIGSAIPSEPATPADSQDEAVCPSCDGTGDAYIPRDGKPAARCGSCGGRGCIPASPEGGKP